MPATVLGKRIRPAAEQASVSTRAKRRITVNEPNDENENPFFVHKQDENAVGAQIRPIKKTCASDRTVPAKHGAFESRVAVSPTKIKSHFHVGKSDVEVYEDDKGNGVPTPKTPRHRDALSKKVAVTPRHRVLLTGTLRTPRTPVTPTGTAVYNQVRKIFSRCAHPGRLVGRDDEREELATFISTRTQSKSGGCLYISGPPGTGKSALLDEVLQEQRQIYDVGVSIVNCMSVRSTKELAQKLSEDLDLEKESGLDKLRSCFVRGKAKDDQKYLVVLDEVDHLADLDLSLLYNLFEWSMDGTSRLILIGIANALDLTDRLLPRLKSRGLKPELLPFMPYSAVQITHVLTGKLKSLTGGDAQEIPFLHPAAIQFCAKKVAGHTGDLRKAFDICRRAIDLVEQETREKDAKSISPTKTPLMENINLSSPSSPSSPSKKTQMTTIYTLATAPKATIAHIAKVTAQVFSNGSTQRLGSINLQQKAVLCALAALEKRGRTHDIQATIYSTPSKSASASAPSIKQLFSAYSVLCKRENLFPPLSSGEFRDVVSGLETLSLVAPVEGRSGSFHPLTPSKTPGRRKKGDFGASAMSGDERKVSSVVGMKELEAALEGPGGELLREILRGDI